MKISGKSFETRISPIGSSVTGKKHLKSLVFAYLPIQSFKIRCSPFMFEQAFRNIDDVLRKEAGCTTELDYTEQSSWLLLLKYLHSPALDKATEAQLEGKKYTHILDKEYRWESWAAPKDKD